MVGLKVTTPSGDPQNVVILGSTGSVGRSTLDVIAAHSERFSVLALAAGRNATGLQQQINQFRPRFVSSESTNTVTGSTVVDSPDALEILATLDDADIVVVATTGHAAIIPTIRALEAGKIVALANKETIVAAGALVMPIARASIGALRPVDSEHSALWQCLGSSRIDSSVRRLVLTASGGPFRGWSAAQLKHVTPEMALKHPNWSMGAKITIDSATLMNKGLELIEAHWLFDCPLDQIAVVVHPQSLMHSCVEYVDGAIVAQIGSHDMRLPIQYALTYPERITNPAASLSVLDLARLDFEEPDQDVFPLLRIAREAAVRGGVYPTILSASDSVAVDAFLAGQIGFADIAVVIEDTLAACPDTGELVSLDQLHQADVWATTRSTECVQIRRANM